MSDGLSRSPGYASSSVRARAGRDSVHRRARCRWMADSFFLPAIRIRPALQIWSCPASGASRSRPRSTGRPRAMHAHPRRPERPKPDVPRHGGSASDRFDANAQSPAFKANRAHMRHTTERPPGHTPRISRRLDRASELVISRSGSGPTVPSSPGPGKIVCEDDSAPPRSVIGSEERDSARQVARCSDPSRVGPKEVGVGHVGPLRPGEVGPRTPRGNKLAIVGLLVFVFICGLGVLAALVPVGHGFVPKGGGWFTPAVADGAFTLHPLLIAVPSAVCFVLGLLDWRRPWRVEHLDVLALAGFFPVAMLLSDDVSQAGLWLAAVCLGWLFCRMLGATFGIWRMPELRPSISSRRLGNPDTAARSDRKCRGGQHSGCRAGELARRLARSARTAPLRGGVLAGPRWASDLPPGLLRPVRLLRVHPIRGCLPAGAARDAAAGGVLRRADTRRPAQADLPDPFIRLPPVLLHVPGEDLLQRPRGRVRRHAGTPCLVQGIHHLPVNIQLDLRGCRVADAHRAGAFVAGQPAQLQLGEPAFTRGTVHDLQLGGISTRTTLA